MALTNGEIEVIGTRITDVLAAKAYASTLTLLSGGTTNLVFRGILERPFSGRQGFLVRSIIVKHSASFARLNKNLPLDITRSVVESHVLNSLARESSGEVIGKVKTPRLLLFDQTTSTQVLEDLTSTVDLKTILVSPASNTIFTSSAAVDIGRHLGAWLRSFHDWTSALAQTELTVIVEQNKNMQRLKQRLACDGVRKVAQDFPELSAEGSDWLKQVESALARDFERTVAGSHVNWGVIHGDFWTGNILVRDDIFSSTVCRAKPHLAVIDWEFCQLGHRSHDIGQMMACFYERKYFNNADGAMAAIDGFAEAYGRVNEDMAFEAAFRVGVYMLGWYTRLAPDSVIPYTAAKVGEWLEIAQSFAVKGATRDRDWFMGTWLRPLFQKEK